MPKPTRGLPSDFSLDVLQGILRGPVQLNDYLDEQDNPPPIAARIPAALPRSRFRETEHNRPPIQRSSNAQRPLMTRLHAATPIDFVETDSEGALSSVGHVRRVSRKQLNLKPETLRMVDELLFFIQTQSVQKDAKASEMFHALIAALYDAREFLSLATVPPRGRWGTPMASAFPVALKNAFQSAIGQWRTRYGG